MFKAGDIVIECCMKLGHPERWPGAMESCKSGIFIRWFGRPSMIPKPTNNSLIMPIIEPGGHVETLTYCPESKLYK